MNRLKGLNQKGENLAKFSNEVKNDLICKHHDYNSLSKLIIYAYTSINVICYSYFWWIMWFVNISWLMLSLEREMAMKEVEVVLFIFSWAYREWVLTVTSGC